FARVLVFLEVFGVVPIFYGAFAANHRQIAELVERRLGFGDGDAAILFLIRRRRWHKPQCPHQVIQVLTMLVPRGARGLARPPPAPPLRRDTAASARRRLQRSLPATAQSPASRAAPPAPRRRSAPDRVLASPRGSARPHCRRAATNVADRRPFRAS